MRRSIAEFISLKAGEESKEKVFENIKSNISFRGSNLWILVCAIIIACVGLNINSTSVIIGAMLISPLMGPIVGTGFALAIADLTLLRKSGKNLLIATLVGLGVAAVYFFVSPFKETQSELIARTSPTIYDVLIAFFGGLVGIIALTRVEKGNPIPGVAIATALMPPLCTAGYGLAIGNLAYFFGAFYLYTINCFFICISTLLIIKYLKYRPVRTLDSAFEKRVRYGISVLILLIVIPSFYLAYRLFEEKDYHYKVEQFIANEFTDNGYTVIYKRVVQNASPKKIELAFLTEKFDDTEITRLNQKLQRYNIANTVLEIKQDTQDIKTEILNELGAREKAMAEKDLQIQSLRHELAAHKTDYTGTLQEMAILFPELRHVSMGKHAVNANTDSFRTSTVVLYRADKRLTNGDLKKLHAWLLQKLNTPEVVLVRQE
jgi:uncharacterized hydrophobic protein (TIGR00271 family)